LDLRKQVLLNQVLEDTLYYYLILTFPQERWIYLEIGLLFIFLLINNSLSFLLSSDFKIHIVSFFIFLYLLFFLVYYFLIYRIEIKKVKTNTISNEVDLSTDLRKKIYYFLLSLVKVRSSNLFISKRYQVERFVILLSFRRKIYLLTFVSFILNAIFCILFLKTYYLIPFFLFFIFLISFPFYTLVYSFIMYLIYPKVKKEDIKIRDKDDKKNIADRNKEIYKEVKMYRGYIYVPKILEEVGISKYIIDLILYRLRKFLVYFIGKEFNKYNAHLVLTFIVLLIFVLIFLIFIAMEIGIIKELSSNKSLNMNCCNLTETSITKEFFSNKFFIFIINSTIAILWFIMVIKFLTAMFPSKYLYRIREIGNDKIVSNFRILYNNHGRIINIHKDYLINSLILNENLNEKETYNFIFNILIVIMLTIIFTVIIGLIGWG